mgnify:CR=1 FL=1
MPESDELFLIGRRSGYTACVGVLVSELENARHYLLGALRGIDHEALHARPDSVPNSVAQIVSHLVAAEALMRAITFEGRMLDAERDPAALAALRFEVEPPDDHGPAAYRDDLAASRATTLAGLRERDDAWLEGSTTFRGRPANRRYYWLHYLQDEARHTGQITLIRKYLLPLPEPDLDPYLPPEPPD